MESSCLAVVVKSKTLGVKRMFWYGVLFAKNQKTRFPFLVPKMWVGFFFFFFFFFRDGGESALALSGFLGLKEEIN